MKRIYLVGYVYLHSSGIGMGNMEAPIDPFPSTQAEITEIERQIEEHFGYNNLRIMGITFLREE